ncbi:MAG: hypothetical protein CM1200mP3_06220 [Chloroflexota bacterium]|nr:MAG: hypothetical protein CM1200mP3_06220 [Chloroflexota bacterium]
MAMRCKLECFQSLNLIEIWAVLGPNFSIEIKFEYIPKCDLILICRPDYLSFLI